MTAAPARQRPALYTWYTLVLGQWICAQRVLRGVSRDQLAEALQITTSSLSRLDNGQVAYRADTLKIVAGVLEMKPHQLVRQVDQMCERLQARGVVVDTTREGEREGLASAAVWAVLEQPAPPCPG